MMVLTASGSDIAASQTPPTEDLRSSSLTDDAFLGGKLQILQPKKGYRAGIDPVFLAAVVPGKPGDTVFEAGIGTGVAALCLAARVENIHITGVEISPHYALLAQQNARRNGLDQNIQVMTGDVSDCLRRDLPNWPRHGTFSHAFANPPYFEVGKVTSPADSRRTTAHSFQPDDLEIWVKILAAMVMDRGSLTIVNQAGALSQLLAAMSGRFGDIRVAALYPRQGLPASRIVVQGIKGSKAPLKILPGLVLHTDGARYTSQAEAILRNAEPWTLR